MKKGSNRFSVIADGRAQPFERLLSLVVGIVLLSVLLCSCESVTFDARQLQQPMVLNNNPFLGPSNTDAFVLTNVDHYAAKTEFSERTWNYTQSGEQVRAFI